LEQARQLEETHQASLSPGIKIRIRETSPGGAELHFRVEIAPNATVITFPVGFSVSLRQFVSIDAEEMYSADSHIRLKHVHLQGEFATREELAQRVLRGWSDPMAGAGGAAPSGGFNQPSKAGYFLSVEEANTQLRQVINGELSARWTSQAQPALEGPNHYFSWTSTARFSRHAQAGLQRNSALGTKAQLAALLASNDISHPSGHGRYRVYPLYPGDPNYEYDPTSGQPNNSANPLTVPEFAGPDFPIYVGLKADPAKHVRGGWYVNSAYPSV
jgi:hypothetical protein